MSNVIPIKVLSGTDGTEEARRLHAQACELDSNIGTYKVAQKLYEAAICLDPNYANAHIDLGVLLSKLGDTAGASRCFRTAVGLTPTYALAWYNYGHTRMTSGEHITAYGCFATAIALSQDGDEDTCINAHFNCGAIMLGVNPTLSRYHYMQYLAAIDDDEDADDVAQAKAAIARCEAEVADQCYLEK